MPVVPMREILDRAFAERYGVAAIDVVVLEELVESRRGTWEGERIADLAPEDPALVRAFEAGDPDFAFPGGESWREQIVRTRAHGAVIRLDDY
jgi:broad specificity phosphatase PhoE